MSKIDQFESAFRSAIRPHYQPRPYPIREILLVIDLDEDDATQFLSKVDPFFSGVTPVPKLTLLPVESSRDLSTLIQSVDDHQPDLICTYRNLHTDHGKYPYTLGDHVEVLTQVTDTPILLLPRPEKLSQISLSAPSRVMAITDHFAQTPELIDAAVSLVDTPGHLILGHVEDDATFERYISIISRIPEIDTDAARRLIQEQMMRDANAFLTQCQEAIQAHQPELQVYSEVQMGHHLQTYVAFLEEHQAQLLVMNTKDDDQLAMHGLSYPLAIELSHLPMLML